jgi:hypothetical protein
VDGELYIVGGLIQARARVRNGHIELLREPPNIALPGWRIASNGALLEFAIGADGSPVMGSPSPFRLHHVKPA